MLVIDNIIVRIAGREILNGASASLPAGRRIGLVGRNGAGKSTLLKVILGQLHTDQGDVTWPRDWRIGAVAQEAPSGPITLLDTVLNADKERTALLARAEHEHDAHELGDIHARLEAIDAYSAPARAASILAGLGFDAADQLRPCSEFSGGWRMRVALAAILFSAPDLLLLDEPTNYLDLEGVLWLEDYLKRYRGSVIVVSHDRDLLNSVTEFILHLEYQKLTLYSGNYDTFVETRAMRRANDVAFAKKQDAARKHMQAFVDRFKAKATKARQAQSRMKMIEKLGAVVAPPIDEHINLSFPSPDQLASPIETIEDVSVGYDKGPLVLKKLDLRLDMDDRIALLGQNGNGKSTFIRLLSDKLVPREGKVRRSSKLRIGYFSQDQEESLDYEGTPFEHMNRALGPGIPEHKVRAQLGRFGFSRERGDLKVGLMSGGEKTRLLLALATRNAPHLLLLDEPTNHLDMDARASLVDAINDYDGAVVLVSHATHLVKMVADQLWVVAGGAVKPFEGDIDDYQAKLLRERNGRPAKEAKAKKEKAPAPAPVVAAAEKPKRGHLKRAIEKAEKEMADLAKKRSEIEAKLADPATYSGPPTVAADLQKEKQRLERDLAHAEHDWLVAQEAYEAA